MASEESSSTGAKGSHRNSKGNPPPPQRSMDYSARTFQEFEPQFDWVHHSESHVLVLHLPGFRTNELKVQVTSAGKLRISGERKPSTSKWLRFQREFEVPADADTDKISAKFEDGMLYIRQAKKAIPRSSQAQVKPEEVKPSTQTPKTTEKPTNEAQSIREIASKSRHDKPKAPENAKRISPPKPQEPTKSKEESKATIKTQKPTAEKSSAGAQSVPGVAPKNRVEKQTDDKPKAQATTKDASEEAPQKERESSWSKKEEEEKKTRDREVEEEKGKSKREGLERSDKDGGLDEVAAEKTGNKAAVKLNDGGIIRKGEGNKEAAAAAAAAVNRLRAKVVSLVLTVLIFVILYLTVTKKANEDGEL